MIGHHYPCYSKRKGMVQRTGWLVITQFFGLATLVMSTSAMAQTSEETIVLPLTQAPVDEAAAKLRSVLTGLGHEVHVFGDSDANQIIVRGTQQARDLAQRLIPSIDQPPTQSTDQPFVNSEAPPSPTDDPDATARVTTRLSQRTFQDIQPRMEELWSKSFQVRQEPAGAMRRYVLTSMSGTKLVVEADPGKNDIVVTGPARQANAWIKIIEAMDRPRQAAGSLTRVVSFDAGDRESLQRALAVFQTGRVQPTKVMTGPGARALGTELAANLFQSRNQGPDRGIDLAQADAAAQPPQLPDDAGVAGGIVGDVEIQFLEGQDLLIIRGRDQDVARVQQIIADIEELSEVTKPEIMIYELKHVDSTSMATLIRDVYTTMLEPRQGTVSITELVKPNALLLIGRQANLQTVVDLIEKLDQPADPEAQFEVFPLRHNAAADVQTTIDDFFNDPERLQLGTKVLVTSDFRSNSVIVRASPRDLAEVGTLIAKIDTATTPAVSQMRVFYLRNSRVEELAEILQAAIVGDAAAGTGARGAIPGLEAGQFQGGGGFGQQQQQGGQQQGQRGQRGGQRAGQTGAQVKSSAVEFTVIGPEGEPETLRSGILSDVQISADPRANALIVRAPEESMTLIAALIEQLDRPPSARMLIKVFTIVNGDALNLSTMLQELFGAQAGAGAQQQPFDGLGGGGDAASALVPLQVSVDERTNSIVVAGSADDLLTVEAILATLDADSLENRVNRVFKLNNVSAEFAAESLNLWLQSERTLQQQFEGVSVSPFQQLQREVVVVAEIDTNSLIVSATPRYFEEVERIIEELDADPPQVAVQVLIAEVVLNNTDELGVELGLQSSVLFERSLIGDLVTLTETITPANQQQVTSQTIVGATNTPGFSFNNFPLGNSGSDRALERSSVVGAQGLSHFSLLRQSPRTGFGGFVFSAGSENVNILLRALQACRRTEILSRPHVMTLHNQTAFIQRGQRVPRVTGTTTTTAGQVIAQVSDPEPIGVLLQVRPRIDDQGFVVMNVQAERSDLLPIEQGIEIATGLTGDPIRSPITEVSQVSTIVRAASGQTVVLGGLLGLDRLSETRRVPYLSNIPILGNLFRYDFEDIERTELLIILTPYVIRGDQDIEYIKQLEASRMSWCLSDVVKIYGDAGLRTRYDEWSDNGMEVVHPDLEGMQYEEISPHGPSMTLPAPSGDQVLPPSSPSPSDVGPGQWVPPSDTPMEPGTTSPDRPWNGPTEDLNQREIRIPDLTPSASNPAPAVRRISETPETANESTSQIADRRAAEQPQPLPEIR